MSLHRIDPRFVLPHRVSRALVLGNLDEWRAGLASAGVDVQRAAGGTPPDLVVTPANLAARALRIGARSVLIEGALPRRRDSAGYHARQLLLRPTRDRPTLALPLDQRAPVEYAIERWSALDRRWKVARMRVARALVGRGVFPAFTSPVVTAGTGDPGPPLLVGAAHHLGVATDATWFLTFGQGDALSRNAFQLFPPRARKPEWVLKFARVAGYSHRFDDDERGLRVAHAAGGVVASHVPRHLGRFALEGVHASLESAAPGRRLHDILQMRADRRLKLALIDRIGMWIVELGRLTAKRPHAIAGEHERLRSEVLPMWRDLGVGSELVDELPPLPAVAQHNDLGSWNVVADGSDFVVVDWENVREVGLPLWDLVYFLADALVLIDGSHHPRERPTRVARLFAGEAPSSPQLFTWVRRAVDAAAIPHDAVGAIVTLCWLAHSLSVHAHNRDLTTWTPDEPPRVHGFEGMADAWMQHPALGPRWPAWQT